uniref:Putative ovule protein n=1 Tax=Solanum chacoense TaxID=4108 RepID=A0A0V0H6X0_SOLCH
MPRCLSSKRNSPLAHLIVSNHSCHNKQSNYLKKTCLKYNVTPHLNKSYSNRLQFCNAKISIIPKS